MASRKGPDRYCAQCGRVIKGRNKTCITERRYYHDECMPQEAVLQMVFHQHEPGTQVTPEEFENICRWVTAESNKRLLMSLRDLTEEQARELARRMMTLTAQILDKDRLDSNDLADLQ